MTIVRDDSAHPSSLAIVEKYEGFVNYIYPILQNCPRKHGVARDVVLADVLALPKGIYAAAKSRQVTKLYAVDGDLANLRWQLRFLAERPRKIITPHQHEVALSHLAEVGRMLGAWIGKIGSGRG